MELERIPFGRTGLTASIAGLGCGGYSRLGQGSGHSEAQAENVVRAAIDLGINFIDTSPSYENEALVGRAIAGRRETIIVSTKFSTLNRDGAAIDGKAVRASLEASLRRLGTDHVDVLAIQSVTPRTYGHVVDAMLPTLEALKCEGKLRAFGLTEWFYDDMGHEMASRAATDGWWDYLLLGYNILNQSADTRVLPAAKANGIATAIMFAVRRALVSGEAFASLVRALVQEGRLDAAELNLQNPLGFLLDDGDCTSLSEAAYRFVRHEAPASVILTGTGNVRHLADNVRAIAAPPLRPAHVAKLRAIFGALDSLTGQETVDGDGRIAKKHVPGKPKGH